MPLLRAFELTVIVALFWAGLYLAGTVPGPDMSRLGRIEQSAHERVVGGAATAGEAAGTAVESYQVTVGTATP